MAVTESAGWLDDVVLAVHRAGGVPGVAVGVVEGSRTATAFAGVTSVEDPLELDRRTLFQVGSVSKTFAVSAVLRLVTEGRVGLEDRVREHLPELVLADEEVAAEVRVRHLLDHTSGWDGTMTSGDTDPGAPLSEFVSGTLPTLEQVGRPGARAEYNNAGVALAGRLVERITGRAYERAVQELLLDPLGLGDTTFTTADLVPERVSVGHVVDDRGMPRVARPWRWPRAANPEGGVVSTVEDMLRWCRFHLARGAAPSGERLIGEGEARPMYSPGTPLIGNVMGDAIGLGWFVTDVGGERTLSHPGATNGQVAEVRLVPARQLGVVVCANAAPTGDSVVREVVDTVLAQRAGLRRSEPELRDYDPVRDHGVLGVFENNLSRLEVRADGTGLEIRFSVQAHAAERLGEGATDFPPSRVRFLAGGRGEYLVVGGGFTGSLGAFPSSASGTVDEAVFGGRWHRRTGP